MNLRHLHRTITGSSIAIVLAAAMLTGCTVADTTDTSNPADAGSEGTVAVLVATTEAATAAQTLAANEEVIATVGPADTTDAVTVTLSGSTATSDGDAVTVDGSTVTITAGGTYVLAGNLTDGSVVVAVADDRRPTPHCSARRT